jgi:hypothetical protein
MKALILSLFAAGALALSPTPARADHGPPQHRGYAGHNRPYDWGGPRYYRPYNYGYYRPYYQSYYRYPYSYAYPYGYSYYGYPQYGVGYTGPNVSFWYGF